ncbi:hypothetical protein [Nocardiopsis alba]
MADNQRGALRGKITDALISHTLTEANGGRPSRIGLDLLPPADRARVEGNARSRADAVMPVIADELDARWEHGRKHGLRQARAPQRGRERQLEAEIESMLTIEEANSAAWLSKCERVRELEAEIDRANLRADRRAADLRARGQQIRELEAENERLRGHIRDAEDYLRLTPAHRDSIDATVARVHRERADAGIMAARYDEACFRIGEMHDEIVRLRRQVQALEDRLSDGERRLREELEARDAERNEEIALRDAEITRLQALADRRWVAYQSARRRAANSRIAAQVLWGQIAHQDARETSLEDSQARILAIVNEWVDQADNGAADHGDLVDDLRAAGYTLPGADDEGNDR